MEATDLRLTAHPAAFATPSDRILTWSLVVAPLVYLVADCLYTANGWDNGDAGAVHVLGAILYGFVALRFTAWSSGWLQAASLVAGVLGTAGNVAYGFNSIQVSLSGIDLVDTDGPGAIIKPLGLFFPLMLVVGALVLRSLHARPSAAFVALAAVLWPVAHIANIGALAIVTNVVLIAGLAPLAFGPVALDRAARRPTSSVD